MALSFSNQTCVEVSVSGGVVILRARQDAAVGAQRLSLLQFCKMNIVNRGVLQLLPS